MTVKYVFNPTTGKLDATDKVAFNGEVNLGTAAAPSIFFTGDPNTGIYSPGADQVAISTGGTGRLLVDASGRVGIGTSGPNVLLHLDSAPAGTGSAGVIGFGDASNYRFAEIEGYREGGSFAGSLIFRTQTSGGISAAGSERLRITSAGLVGIGTSSPTTALTVGGVTPALSLTYNFPLNNTAGALISSVRFGDGDPGREATATISSHVDSLWSAGSGPTALRFNTAPAGSVTALPRMTIDSAGRVGIGTTSPVRPLDILSSTNNNAIGLKNSDTGSGTFDGFSLQSSGLNVGLHNFEAGHIYFATSDTERARIDSSGRLLVGTSSARSNYRNSLVPNIQLEEAGAEGGFAVFHNANAATGPLIWLGKSRGTAAGSNTVVQDNDTLGAIRFNGADGANVILGAQIAANVDGAPGTNDLPTRLVFATTADGASAPTERMRITSAGHILIGQATGDYNTVGNSLFSNGTAQFVSSGLTTLNLNRKASDGVVVQFYRDTNTPGSISVTTTATTYSTSSDYRLKENVVAVTDGITRLQQLKPSRFNFIADPDKTVDGFIAHEVQTIVPEAITGEKDAVDDEGNPVYQGIDQSKLVPLLTAALQEAIGEIESLKARVAALEAS